MVRKCGLCKHILPLHLFAVELLKKDRERGIANLKKDREREEESKNDGIAAIWPACNLQCQQLSFEQSVGTDMANKTCLLFLLRI